MKMLKKLLISIILILVITTSVFANPVPITIDGVDGFFIAEPDVQYVANLFYIIIDQFNAIYEYNGAIGLLKISLVDSYNDFKSEKITPQAFEEDLQIFLRTLVQLEDYHGNQQFIFAEQQQKNYNFFENMFTYYVE